MEGYTRLFWKRSFLTYKGKAIVWYYMMDPVKKGLIWTTPSGDTYLNDKKIGNINYPNEKLTHKKQLVEFYDLLGFGKLMSGDLRKDVEDMNEMNVRGRIIDDEINVYSYEDSGGKMNRKRYEALKEKAIDAFFGNVNVMPE